MAKASRPKVFDFDQQILDSAKREPLQVKFQDKLWTLLPKLSLDAAEEIQKIAGEGSTGQLSTALSLCITGEEREGWNELFADDDVRANIGIEDLTALSEYILSSYTDRPTRGR